MPTSTENRRTWHDGRLRRAPDARSRFWEACNQLAAASRRRGRKTGDLEGALREACDEVLRLAQRVETGRST